jgi:hypothetical protein
MMKRIYKYPLEITGVQPVDMPAGAKLLSVANQNGTLCLWAMVDTDAPNDRRVIVICGTGHAMDDAGLIFIGTVLMGPLVWHVFEGQV